MIRKYIEKIGENRNVEDMYKLGDMYYWWSRDIADAKEDDEDEDFEVSEEEEQCLNAAKYWLRLAAENGHEHAKTMLKNGKICGIMR